MKNITPSNLFPSLAANAVSVTYSCLLFSVGSVAAWCHLTHLALILTARQQHVFLSPKHGLDTLSSDAFLILIGPPPNSRIEYFEYLGQKSRYDFSRVTKHTHRATILSLLSLGQSLVSS